MKRSKAKAEHSTLLLLLEEMDWDFPDRETPEFREYLLANRKEAIDRILTATRLPMKSIDATNALAIDICKAEIESRLLEPQGRALAKQRLRTVERIGKLLDRLIRKIRDADPYIIAQIDNPAGVAARPLDRLLFDHLKLEGDLRYSMRSDAIRSRPVVDGRKVSELEFLAGAALPAVFEKHFGQTATRSHDTESQPDSPAIRFIAASMTELRKPYSKASIDWALKRLAPHRDKLLQSTVGRFLKK